MKPIYNIVDIANMFKDMFNQVITKLNTVHFTNGQQNPSGNPVNVGIGNLLIAFVIFSIIIAVLWKGARK